MLFAATCSSAGSARGLILQTVIGQMETLVSHDMLAGVERNIGRKAPELLDRYPHLLRLISPTIVADPTSEEVGAAEKYVAPKDAAIVVAAIKAPADYLVTYDRKCPLGPIAVAQLSGLTIALLAEVLATIKRSGPM